MLRESIGYAVIFSFNLTVLKTTTLSFLIPDENSSRELLDLRVNEIWNKMPFTIYGFCNALSER